VSSSFSNTTRALKQDSLRLSQIGLGLVIFIWLLWGGWFFGGSVPVYQPGELGEVNPEGIVIATFPLKTIENLSYQQVGRLHLGAPSQSISLAISDIDRELGEVVFIVPHDIDAVKLYEHPVISIDIEIATVSPAWFILQVMGLL